MLKILETLGNGKHHGRTFSWCSLKFKIIHLFHDVLHFNLFFMGFLFLFCCVAGGLGGIGMGLGPGGQPINANRLSGGGGMGSMGPGGQSNTCFSCFIFILFILMQVQTILKKVFVNTYVFVHHFDVASLRRSSATGMDSGYGGMSRLGGKILFIGFSLVVIVPVND